MHQVDLLLVRLAGQRAAHQLVAQEHQIGVGDVSLAVIADRGDLAALVALPHLSAAHAELEPPSPSFDADWDAWDEPRWRLDEESAE